MEEPAQVRPTIKPDRIIIINMKVSSIHTNVTLHL
jgi:hypothetical protein